ncbi:MAG TPA: sulfatase-like hydrolase/transferase [Pirellulales bacterium]|jgi:arylsulfatase A-like enzyme|nr:sulfatase-like hydrolase/transferase [Pirellulales bacterium]
MSLLGRAILSLAVAVVFSSPSAYADSATRPNVLVILSDDQGWGDLSVHGNTNLSTPNVDSLARDGALFERFFVCPVCSPTRGEFLTGRYHPRLGVYSTSAGGERLDLDETTIGDVFRAAGYATAAYGKWHNGSQWPYHPNARGFADYYGFPSGHWGDYFSPPLEHNGQIVRGNGFIIDDLTDHAMAFIEAHRAKPFFCYLPLNTPHSPMQVPDRFWDKFRDAELKLRDVDPPKEDVDFTRAALAMCENVDWNVGRLLAKLDELKLADNTIVVYFCDNGPNSNRWNGGMRGRKGSTDEGGVRSPLLMRWPGHIPAGTKVPQIAAAIDLLPTLAELTAVPVTAKKPLDGTSVAPLVLGQSTNWPDRLIFSHWNGKVSVRSQQHRLDSDGRLYDLAADPGQANDIAGEQPDAAARLRTAALEWRSDVLSELNTDDERPFPVGYREFPVTHLPARDGEAHGHVKRSAGAPNCSFFTGWTNTSDRITWHVDVATAGRYDVVIHYTCTPANVGANVELSFLDSACDGKVTEAHDPPLRGMEHDRVPRKGESYVKDFKPWKLGTATLPQGRGMLTLRALDVPGPGVIDVRGVTLTLLP